MRLFLSHGQFPHYEKSSPFSFPLQKACFANEKSMKSGEFAVLCVCVCVWRGVGVCVHRFPLSETAIVASQCTWMSDDFFYLMNSLGNIKVTVILSLCWYFSL